LKNEPFGKAILVADVPSRLSIAVEFAEELDDIPTAACALNANSLPQAQVAPRSAAAWLGRTTLDEPGAKFLVHVSDQWPIV
jgi:hypothetical protein